MIVCPLKVGKSMPRLLHRSRRSITLFAIGFLSSTWVAVAASATSTAVLATTPTSTAIITIRMDITTSLGSSSDTDTQTVTVTGPAQMVLSPNLPPWAMSDLTQLDLALGGATYSFDFFCIPFFGCQHLDLTLSNMRITLVSPTSSPVSTTGGVFYPNGQYAVHSDYVFSGFTSGAGSSDTVNPSDFGARLTPSGSTLTLDQCQISAQVVQIPPESLPSGVSAVTLTITPNLANTRFTGPWAPDTHPADLNGDGAIDGIDLATMLSAWGTAGADINGDGTTDGVDFATLLSAWTG